MSESNEAKPSIELKHLASIGDQQYPSVELRYLLDYLRKHGKGEWCDALVEEFDLDSHLQEEFIPSYLALECNNRIVEDHFFVGLGVEVGENYGLDDFGILGAALRHAPTLYEALQITLGYYELIGSLTDQTIIQDENTFTIRLVNVASLSEELVHLLFELTISGMVSLGRTIAERDFRIDTIRFCLRLSEDQKNYFRNRYQCKVEDQAKFDEFVLDLEDLKRDITYAPMARNDLDKSIQDLNVLMETLKNEFALVDRFDSFVRNNEEEFPNSKEIAEALHMSERTFRRKLKSIGLNYNMLMGKIRCQIAIAMLQCGEHTNEDVAFALGFSDAANFCNAFKKWTGHTPNFYRP